MRAFHVLKVLPGSRVQVFLRVFVLVILCKNFFLTVFEPVLIFLYARSLNKMLNLKKRASGNIFLELNIFLLIDKIALHITTTYKIVYHGFIISGKH